VSLSQVIDLQQWRWSSPVQKNYPEQKNYPVQKNYPEQKNRITLSKGFGLMLVVVMLILVSSRILCVWNMCS